MKTIIDYDRDNLINLIKNAEIQIENQYNYLKDLYEYSENYCKLYEKKIKKQKSTVDILILTFGLILIFIICLIRLSKILPLEIFNSFLAVLALIYILIVSIIPVSYFSSKHSTKKELKKYKAKAEQQIQLINELRSKTDALLIIPFMYQTPVAMKEIKEYLINYRATTWTDAVNLLEETIHRNQMLYLQSKQLSALNQQLDILNGIKKNTQTSCLDVAQFIIGLAG